MQNTAFWLQTVQQLCTETVAANRDLTLHSVRAQAEVLLRMAGTFALYPERAAEVRTRATIDADCVFARRTGMDELLGEPSERSELGETVWIASARALGTRARERFEIMLDDCVRGLGSFGVSPSLLDWAIDAATALAAGEEPTADGHTDAIMVGCELVRGGLDPSHGEEIAACNGMCVTLDRARKNGGCGERFTEAAGLLADIRDRAIIGELFVSPVLADMFVRRSLRAARLCGNG